MRYTISIYLVLITTAIYGQDAENCADYPSLKRMANTYILQCSTGDEAIEMALTDSTSETVTGKRYYARYAYNSKSGFPAPTYADVINYFETVFLKNGGKKIYDGRGSGVATFRAKINAKDQWITVNDYSDYSPGSYEIVIVETSGKKKVTALSLNDDLENKGSTTLYMQFENNKAVISSESIGLIDVIADLLLTETDLKVSIESHTNNNGSAGENMKISTDRAKAIYDALVLKGVDKYRLKYKGWGQTKPVSDTTTDEGREMNNRIELIKIKPETKTNTK